MLLAITCQGKQQAYLFNLDNKIVATRIKSKRSLSLSLDNG